MTDYHPRSLGGAVRDALAEMRVVIVTGLRQSGKSTFLVRLAALRTGQVLTISELARDAKLNAVTTSRYLSLLELSFVITRLTPYLANRASRAFLDKTPRCRLGVLAYGGTEYVKLGDRLWAIPLSLVLA